MELNLLLPVPTSINKLYINEYQYQKNFVTKKVERVPTGRRILSKEGRAVKAQIQGRARVQLNEQPHWDYEWTKENFVYQDTIIYFARRGSDDNNIYKLLNDSLEGITYDNDSRVLVRTQRIVYDSQNPRIEVSIKPVEFIGIFENAETLEGFQKDCEGCSKYRKGSCSILKDSIAGTVREEIGSIHNPICTAYKEKK
ncbi:RusA family crossover junction endodeoxyribonuclease [Paenibacillus agilis]|uniref:RusA family crossover junction endodeoxyribonuclease n=1 Tax=Paenibacillus agilis TaxID=3020863 RepID=A0A559IE81_9BACL|nr:RusA family crossover junction endodeoxyribonuclease [Paenibacillus agilis]TVX85962.1 RusA family crossover junction endodeoxyribonuclease [Paenibacillus agilis]